VQDVEAGLKRKLVLSQLELLRLRNTSKAFLGSMQINETSDKEIDMKWVNQNEFAHLTANLKTCNFSINYSEAGETRILSF
jgi:sucrose phosphorylase